LLNGFLKAATDNAVVKVLFVRLAAICQAKFLQFASMAAFGKLHCGATTLCERQLWAGSGTLHDGRKVSIRRKCEVERAARRNRALRASTSFFCCANAAKVGRKPIVSNAAQCINNRKLRTAVFGGAGYASNVCFRRREGKTFMFVKTLRHPNTQTTFGLSGGLGVYEFSYLFSHCFSVFRQDYRSCVLTYYARRFVAEPK
jgi:hypothetical protein